MSIKGNNRVILGLLVVLAVLVVILAAAVGVKVFVWQRNIKMDEILSILNESVKLSGEEWNRDDRIKTSYAAEQESSVGKAVKRRRKQMWEAKMQRKRQQIMKTGIIVGRMRLRLRIIRKMEKFGRR